MGNLEVILLGDSVPCPDASNALAWALEFSRLANRKPVLSFSVEKAVHMKTQHNTKQKNTRPIFG